MNNLTPLWLERIRLLDIAFQPILHMNSARLYAVEALLRNVQALGFHAIYEIFDAAFKDNVLYAFDLALRKKALLKFTEIEGYASIKLFYNLDNRLLEMPDFCTGNTKEMLEALKLKQENLCFEISERHEFSNDTNMERLVTHYKDGGFSVAIDDFGTGFSGYKLLYQFTPDMIKIDRFFLTAIEKDSKRKMMVRSITQLALQLGIKVIAEGVETRQELLTCREIGCHFVQGYLVQYPSCDTKAIKPIYPDIAEYFRGDKRQKSRAIEAFIQKIKPLPRSVKGAEVLEYFKNYEESEVLPLIDAQGEPVGVIEERTVKQYLFSPYGHSLFVNNANERSKLGSIIKKYPSVDIHTDINEIIDISTQNVGGVGVIITKDAKYHGFLDTLSMLHMMHEQNLINARDQNPLTKLPGNKMIDDFMTKALASKNAYLFCYFDLNHFKPFNDLYGFRNGDRVLKLFADILEKRLDKNYFKGHIGGDDFFVARACDGESTGFIEELSSLQALFEDGVKVFYTEQERDRGYIVSQNRENELQKFRLLSVSASIIEIDKESKMRSVERVNRLFSSQKKMAKSMQNHLSRVCLL